MAGDLYLLARKKITHIQAGAIRKTIMKGIVLKTLLMVLSMVALSANAALISREFKGNDCSGYFGTGFDSCTVFINEAGERIELSPVIAKFGGDLTLSETNDTLFPSVTGDEFSFSNTTASNKTGDWSYTPGQNDPGVRYWATKAGGNFLLFWEVDDSALLSGGACDVADFYTLSCLDAAMIVSASDWTTPDDKELSHITFYDTAVIPVPAAAWFFASAIAGLLGARRQR